MHVQRDEGLFGVGRIANEMNAEGNKILTKISNENEMANEGAVYFVLRELFFVGHVMLNEFDGVLHDRGKVRVVPGRFVFRENNMTTRPTKGHHSSNACGIAITESLMVDLSFRRNGSHRPRRVPLGPPWKLRHGLLWAQHHGGDRRLRQSRRRDFQLLAHVQRHFEALVLSALVHFVPGFARFLKRDLGDARTLLRERRLTHGTQTKA